MFKKILIANRGEIACRVMTTAKRLGVQTIAVYSQADADSRHVTLADEAFLIGPPPAAESYLRGDAIIECALKAGAEAIHPGYGFLSENPQFVADVEKAGLTFIGPSAEAIKAMGLKDSAKLLMEKANVPVVPGYHGDNQDPAFLAREAEKIGYPVLIKARAGGGGKGMRLVENPEEFSSNLESAQREAESSFGDPVCLIEKYISQPRHIELQVFGDKQGNVVHLFERDCSLQRRHQKVIEEAPAPGMTANVRKAMGKAACEAAKAISYAGAGTIEFIVDGSGPLREDGFWFMEMNTRLQVEHPVSEAITGLDFVELQLRVASGESLPVSQNDLSINGWSFEARVYAEDVPKGFLPATGTVDYLACPDASEFAPGSVRIDSGIRQGDAISPFYDPMIAKVIVHGPTRETALKMLGSALRDYRVGGTVTNLAFLSALSHHAGFAKGHVDTNLIARDFDNLISFDKPDNLVLCTAALAALGFVGSPDEECSSANPLFGWRHWSHAHHNTTLQFEGSVFESIVSIIRHDRFKVACDGFVQELDIDMRADGGLNIQAGNHRTKLHVNRRGAVIDVTRDGYVFSFEIPDKTKGEDEDAGAGDVIIAPMPGCVIALDAVKGAKVKAGERLMVLEAMKMEHALAATRDAIIEEVLVFVGDQVQDGALLVKLEPQDG